jgi:hypothetical protein
VLHINLLYLIWNCSDCIFYKKRSLLLITRRIILNIPRALSSVKRPGRKMSRPYT